MRDIKGIDSLAHELEEKQYKAAGYNLSDEILFDHFIQSKSLVLLERREEIV